MHLTKVKDPNIISAFSYLPAIVVLSLSFLLLAYATASGQTAPVIKKVEIKGNKKISTSTISAQMQSRTGTPFAKSAVQQDIKTLYKIGYFDDIRVEVESFEGGVSLSYTFQEKPTIISLDGLS